MNVSGTLYTYEDNFRAYKILIAANYSGAEVKVACKSPEFVFGETNKTPEFLKRFPLGKVPAFETATGQSIFESNAIAHFVANDKLSPKSHIDYSLMIQWIQFAENELLPHIATWIFPYLGVIPYNKNSEEKAIAETKNLLSLVNKHLLYNTFLVGEKITLADVVLATYLIKPYQMLFMPEYRKENKNLLRWFNTLVHQLEFQKVVGKINYCDKLPHIEVVTDKSKKIKKDVEKKEQPKKKEVKETNEEEEDIGATEEKNFKDPLSELPKGSFNMDEFKRAYSNNETSMSIPFFWEKFDPENYSIWICEYKYPEELKKIYMSCNLITGMFQRLDKMRKNAFGSMVLFGEDNKSTISGIWVWRGQNLAFELSPDWQIDYESYSWKKLDAKSPETKKIVDEYLAWEGDFNGKKVSQGKIFK